MKVISVENVSKKFVLAHTRPKNLADAARNVFSRSEREDFWALKDVSFDVQQGEALGIIGHNGAGKSTMLKLLTRIMEPTSGRIRTRGRISALIEVGAGFHPEMTGRENVYLNGSILGMTKREIDSKFDEIVAFAELEKFIDTPVKRYSSGMYVRLGFAVAAHTNPDVLLIDEVLSVGDTSFQAKCAARMSELQKTGVTLVFVSHNLGAVESYCTKGIVLHHGRVYYAGVSKSAVDTYLDLTKNADQENQQYFPLRAKSIVITGMRLQDGNANTVSYTYPQKDLAVSIDYTVKEPIRNPRIRFGIYQERFGTLCQATSDDADCGVLAAGPGTCTCVFRSLPLRPRDYQLWFCIWSEADATESIPWQRIGSINIMDETGPVIGCEKLYAPVIVSSSFVIREVGAK